MAHNRGNVSDFEGGESSRAFSFRECARGREARACMELPITLCFMDVTLDIRQRGSAQIGRASVPEVPCAAARWPANVGTPRKSTSPGSRGAEPALRAQPGREFPPEGGAQFESPSPRARAGMDRPRFVVRRARRPGAVAAPVGSYQRRAPRSMRRCSGGALAEGSRRVASRPRVKPGASFHRAPARHARSPSRASPSPA